MNESHFTRLAALLEAERLAERERSLEALAGEPSAALVSRGLRLADLVAAEETALAGRALVTYARSGGGELGATRIGVGSIVRVGSARGKLGTHTDFHLEAMANPGKSVCVPSFPPEGVVARRTRTQVSVAFDDPPPDWATRGKVALTVIPSEVTWQRLLAAVRKVAEPAGGLGRSARELVLGNVGPAAGTAPAPAPVTRVSGAGSGAGGGAGEAVTRGALNAEQQAAVAHALSGQRAALVHGPPGTGKTSVLVEVVRRAVAEGARVLCTAASNAAVDLLVERVGAQGIDVVRLGHPARVSPAVLERTLELLARDREAARIARQCTEEALALLREASKSGRRRGPGRFSEARAARREAGRLFAEARRLEKAAELEVLERTPVVAATLTSLDDARLDLLPFDLAVVDEATQALEPATYLALLAAPRVVLAGDHRQLPPTVISEEAQRGGLGVSLFERLVELYPESCRALAVQHRMHQAIMRYPNEALYGGALRAHPAVAAHTLGGLPHVTAIDDSPLELLDTAGAGLSDELPEGGQSHRNPGEAELVVREVRALLAAGLRPDELAVISPYDAQVQLLRQRLPEADLEIDTVDAFQGREKEAVVVSLVRSNDAGEVGFLADVRRMNVAITRARRKLVIVGDSATVSAHPFYKAFVEHVEKHGRYRSVWSEGR